MDTLSLTDARAALQAADDLRDEGHVEEALAAYRELADAFASSEAPDVQRIAGLALVRTGLRLAKLGRAQEAVSVYDELDRRLGASDDAAVLEVVAQGALYRGIDLRDLGETDRALASYDAVEARFRDSMHPKTREHVAWAMWNRGRLLRKLDRNDEALRAFASLVARFERAEEPVVRGRVAWALWNEALLFEADGRTGDARACEDELVARRDEVVVESVGELMQWILWQRFRAARDVGDASTARAVLEELFDRTLRFSDEGSAKTLSDALEWRAWDVRDDSEAVIDVYDDGLSRLDPERHALAVGDTLRKKGRLLQHAGRDAEAAIVLRGAVAASQTARSTASAVRALLDEARSLGRIDPQATASCVARARELLGAAAAEPSRPAPNEAALASLLSETFAGHCWFVFATGAEGVEADVLRDRALELYEQTAPVFRPDLDVGSPMFAAASVLRTLADAYAALAAHAGSSGRLTAPMPSRPLAAARLRGVGVVEWVEELGFTLELGPESEDERIEALAAESLSGGETDQERLSESLAAAFVSATATYEVFDLVAATERGRDLVGDADLTKQAVFLLTQGKQWAVTALYLLDAAVGPAAAVLLMAQADYAAVHGRRVGPDRATLRAFLRATDGVDWLQDNDVPVPEWLAED